MSANPTPVPYANAVGPAPSTSTALGNKSLLSLLTKKPKGTPTASNAPVALSSAQIGSNVTDIVTSTKAAPATMASKISSLFKKTRASNAATRAAYKARTSSYSPTAVGTTEVPATGLMAAISSRINVALATFKTKPVSTSTGGGSAVVQEPPTIVPPPNATSAVAQQVDTSTQLYENTVTNAGTGAGRTSLPTPLKRTIPSWAYIILAVLGGALLLGFAHDRGKL
jgi:hypothetical protein